MTMVFVFGVVTSTTSKQPKYKQTIDGTAFHVDWNNRVLGVSHSIHPAMMLLGLMLMTSLPCKPTAPGPRAA